MSFRRLVVAVSLCSALASRPSAASTATREAPSIDASGLRIELTARPGALWRFAPDLGRAGPRLRAARLPARREAVSALPERLERVGEPGRASGRTSRSTASAACCARTHRSRSRCRFRLSDLSPIVRFQYVLTATRPHAFSRSGSEDEMSVPATSLEGLPRAREVRLSEFVELLHSYTLSERAVDAGDFEAGLGVMGPILRRLRRPAHDAPAYEHGSQAPDAFLRFDLGPGRAGPCAGSRGTTVAGRWWTPPHPYETVWMQAGLVAGDEDTTAEAYRRFVRTELSRPEAARPRVHYNTWNFQERNRWWNGRRYLDSMNAERMLAEIDVAHRMGIETFVLDTGWYEKTGDWAVSRARVSRRGSRPLRSRRSTPTA